MLASAPAPEEIAFTGALVHTVSGASIEGGSVLVRGDKIVAVGKSIAIPASAKKIDCTGKVITPGLVDSDTGIGLVEISLESSTVDQAPALPDPVRAAVSAKDAIDPRSTLIGVARRHG